MGFEEVVAEGAHFVEGSANILNNIVRDQVPSEGFIVDHHAGPVG